MIEQLEGQMSIFDLDIWSGRTYLEHSAPTKAKISESYSKKRQKWQKGVPAFLNLRKDSDGRNREPSWEMGGALPGEYMMRSFGECPSEERESLLSQILEETPHQKYSLSPKACMGILRRAQRRGKELPQTLKKALERQSAFKSELENPGGGKGILIQDERTGALSTFNNQSVYCLQGNGIDRADTAGCNGRGWRENQSYTLNTIDRPAVYDARGNGDGETVPTITGDHENRITDYTAVCIGNGQLNQISMSNKANTLDTMHDQQAVMAYGLDRASYNQGANAKFDFSVEKERIGAQTARGPGAVCALDFRNVKESNISATLQANACHNLNSGNCLRIESYVRRLTPLECERLQGYPSSRPDIPDWIDTKGKQRKTSDSARYTALGNSIALPFWEWMAKKMVQYIDHEPTMASLFDGIGGFPLVYTRAGCKPIWASEIEEFPIAVTKIRFPEIPQTD